MFDGQAAEAEAGVHHQGGTDDQQCVGLSQRCDCQVDARARNRLSKKHHVGLQYAATLRTCRDLEGAEIHCVKVGIAIRRERRGEPGESWVERGQIALEIHAVQA